MQSRHNLTKALAIHAVPEIHISQEIMGLVAIVGVWVLSDYSAEILFGNFHMVQRCFDSRSVKERSLGMLDGIPQHEHLIGIIRSLEDVGLSLGNRPRE